jgi:hypothetical protein
MAQIFISYRRHDSAYLAATLSDKLQQHFGPNSVFFDVDNIPLGVDFREYIGNAVGQCDVLLVIIGDQWMGSTGSPVKRRIDDPSDYVRIEIESALKRDIPIIPVLVEDATMPAAADLPESLQAIVFRNAAEIRAGRDLRQHIDLLIQGLETILKSSAPDAQIKPRPPEIKTTPEEKPDSAEIAAISSEPRPSVEKAKTRKKPARDTKPRKPAKAGSNFPELLEEIQNVLNGFSDTYLYLGDEVPPIKLENAIGAYAFHVLPQDVLLLYDNTNFGGAKDGFLLTNDAVYWHNITEKANKCSYSDVQTVKVVASTGFKSLYTAANILINEQRIDLSTGKKNEVAEAVANVIRHMAGKMTRSNKASD